MVETFCHASAATILHPIINMKFVKRRARCLNVRFFPGSVFLVPISIHHRQFIIWIRK